MGELVGIAKVSSSGGSTSVTTKGDLQGYDTAADRIPVGADGSKLMADSTQALGVGWNSDLGFPTSLTFMGYSGTTAALGAIRFQRVFGQGLITKIRIGVGVQSGNIDVGVYAGASSQGITNAVPGALKGHSGSVACPASGFADVSLLASTQVNPGDWFALTADNGTATFQMTGPNATNTFATGLSPYQTPANVVPLPSSVTPNGVAQVVYIMVGIA